MLWVGMPKQQPCAICGTAVELWVVLRSGGRKVAEATFYPVCYPDLERILHEPEAARSAA